MSNDITKVVVLCEEVETNPAIIEYLRKRNLLGRCLLVSAPGSTQVLKEQVERQINALAEHGIDEAFIVTGIDRPADPRRLVWGTEFPYQVDQQPVTSVYFTMMSHEVARRTGVFLPTSVTYTTYPW